MIPTILAFLIHLTTSRPHPTPIYSRRTAVILIIICCVMCSGHG
jgi:hypothetical protein